MFAAATVTSLVAVESAACSFPILMVRQTERSISENVHDKYLTYTIISLIISLELFKKYRHEEKRPQAASLTISLVPLTTWNFKAVRTHDMDRIDGLIREC